MKTRTFISLLLAAPIALFAAHHENKGMESMGGDHSGHKQDMKAMKGGAKTDVAVAVIYPTAGNDTQGVVTFTQSKKGVKVEGRIENLSPGMHGFHVHQYGDLRKDDGTSAGGHFNPKGKPHGAPHDKMRHVGDLGNIEADADGVAEFSFVDEGIQMKGAASIIGRGLIVHAGEDDLQSQPTGAAGARVGMAVIGVAEK